MNIVHKFNIAQRALNFGFGQVPNYAIVYVDGRCNMHCSSAVTLQWMQEKFTIMPTDWGNTFKRAKSLLHLTITGGEPLRKI